MCSAQKVVKSVEQIGGAEVLIVHPCSYAVVSSVEQLEHCDLNAMT